MAPIKSVTHGSPDTTVVVVCPACGKEKSVTVRESDWRRWVGGGCRDLIYSAFPYLKADERELLISGICGDCWDSMFREDDEQ